MRPSLGSKTIRNGKRNHIQGVQGQSIRDRGNNKDFATGQKLDHVKEPLAKKTSQGALHIDNDNNGNTTDTADNTVQALDENPSKNLRNCRRPDCSEEMLHDAINSSFVNSQSIEIDSDLHIQQLKISELEVQLKTPSIPAGHWPFAGRKLFPPLGCLPNSTIKHLARNAGNVRAPVVTYSPIHEVGQLARMHIWRKRVFVCKSFEELLMLLRQLESLLDYSVSCCLLITISNLNGIFSFFVFV